MPTLWKGALGIALALLATAPVTAQDRRASLWVTVRNSQSFGYPDAEFRNLHVDVASGTTLAALDLDVRIRTRNETVRCLNEVSLYPQEPLELLCSQGFGSAKAAVADITAVRATVQTARLFARPTDYLCREQSRGDLFPGTRIFACDPR